MLKKANIIGSLSLLVTTPCFSGFYIGAGVGPEAARFNQNAHITRPGTFNVVDRENYSGMGVFGTLFAGYAWNYKRFYLAGEVNGNISSLEYKLTNIEYLHGNLSQTTFTIKSSGGISALPGFFLNENTLFYGRIGYINGRVKINESDPTIQSASSNADGLRWGLGLRQNILERWTVMMDYSQAHYQNIDSFVFEPFGGVAKSTQIFPNSAQVAFGIIYNFDVPKKEYAK